MFTSDSALNVILVFLFGELDEHFAYFLLIYLVYCFLSNYLIKQQCYLESNAQSLYCLKGASPLLILALTNILDHQIQEYTNICIRNVYTAVYTIFVICKISPYLYDETFFFSKTVISIANKLHEKIDSILNKT